jgi:Integrase zinc binding domain
LDEYCKNVIEQHHVNGAEHLVDERGLIGRTDPNSGRLQVCVPKSLRERAITLAHYPKLACHSGSRRMYQTMSREIFWQSMSWNVQEFVGRCASCARKRLSTQCKTTYLNSFHRLHRSSLFPWTYWARFQKRMTVTVSYLLLKIDFQNLREQSP